ncbi:hypothetical protein RHGRI_011567 [Rhododendron griersonianum]|uniref:Uncharacterized protein n=1 Tax=Rhododendron griersonianum TaxID=479676 RepID=A0AAV6KN76_9ERIC|nr:hypothetical protein RHGRI_011567 [Rhododendron griersonianum]
MGNETQMLEDAEAGRQLRSPVLYIRPPPARRIDGRMSRGKCDQGSSRVQPGSDSLAPCWWPTIDVPGWKLCTLCVCTKDPSSKEEEASLEEEDEEGEAEARCFCTRRIDMVGKFVMLLLFRLTFLVIGQVFARIVFALVHPFFVFDTLEIVHCSSKLKDAKVVFRSGKAWTVEEFSNCKKNNQVKK